MRHKDIFLKAAIVIPPIFDFYFTPHRFSGLGSDILCKLVNENGGHADIFNFPLQHKKAIKQSLPETLKYLKPYILENEVGKLSFFTNYQRFGPCVSDCALQILSHHPDLICISCFAFCYADTTLELADCIRKIDPKIPIIVGGAGVSAYPEYFIRHSAIDFAVTGEAEVCMSLFLNMMKSGSAEFNQVPNLYYKINDKIVSPLIVKRTSSNDMAFVLKKTFETGDKIYFTTVLSRGCPKQCRFCSNFLAHGRQFRTMPISAVRDGLSNFYDLNGKTQKKVFINFEDDNLLCDPQYFLSILDVFKSRFPDAVFMAENGMDYTRMTPDLLRKLIEYGIGQLNISMASMHSETLEREKREFRRPLYEEILAILKQRHIPSVTYFICGFKQEVKAQTMANLSYLAALPTRLGISLFYPVPGIFDFQDRAFFNHIPLHRCAGSSAYPWNQSLSTCEMVTAFRLTRLVNLIKSQTRTETDNTLIQKIIKEQKLYTLIKNGKARHIIEVPNIDKEMVQLLFTDFKHSY